VWFERGIPPALIQSWISGKERKELRGARGSVERGGKKRTISNFGKAHQRFRFGPSVPREKLPAAALMASLYVRLHLRHSSDVREKEWRGIDC
jgi:hypothetical protein